GPEIETVDPVEAKEHYYRLWDQFMLHSRDHGDVNETRSHKLLMCFREFVEMAYDVNHDPTACPVKFDSVSCWPETPAGTTRAIPCFEEFNGIYYNSPENATLYCDSNGTWDSLSDYSLCLNGVHPTDSNFNSTVGMTRTIYFVSYSLSLAAVTIAIAIFITFKDLRCLRNNIHTNLLFTYLFHN
ncbi:unnamed protein product, partial [Meganyctiphanes norvegica]